MCSKPSYLRVRASCAPCLPLCLLGDPSGAGCAPHTTAKKLCECVSSFWHRSLRATSCAASRWWQSVSSRRRAELLELKPREREKVARVCGDPPTHVGPRTDKFVCPPRPRGVCRPCASGMRAVPVRSITYLINRSAERQVGAFCVEPPALAWPATGGARHSFCCCCCYCCSSSTSPLSS